MSNKKLEFYNIILCAIVGNFTFRACDENLLLSMVFSIVILLFIFRVIKIEKYIKRYLIK